MAAIAQDALTHDLTRFREDLAQLAEPTGAYAQRIETAMQTALDLLLQAIVDRTPSNFGHLRGSETTQIYGQPWNFYGEVLAPLPYGEAVEFGRAAGKWPPRDAIELWVVRKGLAQADTPEARSAAFLIARAIGQGRSRGTANTGAHMFAEGLAAAVPAIDRALEDMVDDLLHMLATEGAGMSA